MKAIEWALNIARQSAECLLTDNPFEAWDKFVEEDELGVFCDTSTTRMQQAETTTARPMRQQLGDAIKRLDEYHRCLTGFLDDLSKLENFDTALRLSNNLTGDPPLETAETRKKNERKQTRVGEVSMLQNKPGATPPRLYDPRERRAKNCRTRRWF
jgi:hypothetical protein